MRYRVRHRSAYCYAQPVVTSFHRFHLTPRSGHGQHLGGHCITLHEGEGEDDLLAVDHVMDLGCDHFGNRCTRVELLRPYSALAISGWSTIRVDRVPPSGPTVAWNQPIQGFDPTIDEFRFDSLHVHRHDDLAAYAARSFTPGRPLLEALTAFTAQIFDECTYDDKATDISTPPLEILSTRRGVCQDFAHLGIACLRSLGLAACYVSGYLETAPPEGQARLIGADASHAWFALHDRDLGWIHADPTNGILVGDRHVITAIGRDFADVSPIIGIIYGGGAQTLTIGVDVIPESEWAGHPLMAQWPAGAT